MTALKVILSLAPAALAAAYASVANSYELYLLATVGFYAMVGVGLNVLLGLTGQVSLGHVGFYAIGAYAVAILTVDAGFGFWPAMLVALVLTGVIGVLLSIPALRVTGPYLAMVTIAFAFIVEHGAVEWRELTGGANGMMNIPPVGLFGTPFSELSTAYLIIVLTSVLLFLYWRFADSTWGLAMRAVRDSEVAGSSLGLNPVLIRSTAFGLSAVAAGLAGGLFAPVTAFVSPSSFSFFQSILFLLVVIIGGSGTVFGPLVGAAIVVLLPEFLSGFAEYRLLFFGGLLLVVMWMAPTGIVGSLGYLFGKMRKSGQAAGSSDEKRGETDIGSFLAREDTADKLAVTGLAISFGGVQAVKGLDFTAPAGRITSIIGPNGAGKTTVLNMIGGFYKPTTGSITLGRAELAGRSSHAVSRAGISRTYQTTQLFGGLTVMENLLVALDRGQLGGVVSAMKHAREDEEAAAQCRLLLDFVGYTGSPDTAANKLAHVDKRLVEIARALATRPKVLLLDEPAAGLSVHDTEELVPLLRRIAAAGVIVILVEHDMGLVMEVSDHIIVLDAGTPIAAGKPAQVRANQKVREAYLGTGEVVDRARARPLADMPDMLKATNLSAGYGAAPVLNNVDISVRESEFVAVLGANGAGKSTLMRALSGLHRPVEGRILFIGGEITEWRAHNVAREGLVLVPEGRQVFPELSVVDNIRLGAYSRTDFDEIAEIEAMLERFPALRARRGNRAGLLSGGEQQMLAIARGLVAKPKVIMFDEPSLGLAPALIENLFTVLAELRDEGRTILLVDQMAALALSVADRGYVLESGHVVHEGSAVELSGDKSVEQAYLGGGA